MNNFPMSKEEVAACERVADAVIALAELSAARTATTVESRIIGFFRVAGSGGWEKLTLDQYRDRLARRTKP